MLKTKIKELIKPSQMSINEYLPKPYDEYGNMTKYLMTIAYSPSWAYGCISYPFYRQSLRREGNFTYVSESAKVLVSSRGEGYADQYAYFTREFSTGGGSVFFTNRDIVEFVFDDKQFLARFADGSIIPIKDIPQKYRKFKQDNRWA